VSVPVGIGIHYHRGMATARTPIHPGEILKDELVELGISAAELARQIEVPPNRVRQILSGRRAVTADTALRLARWFGTSAELWMNLQQIYEIDLARQRVGEAIGRLSTRPAMPLAEPAE
jgi:addiction module HigA family antidote